MFIDSHLHFDSFEEAGQVEPVIARAAAAGIDAMLAIGGSIAANDRALGLARRYPGRIFAAAGYDRDEAERQPPLDRLDAVLAHSEVVAVGETGLDYHYSADTAEAQRRLLAAMLERARRHRLPVVLHSRDADDDMLALLQRHAASWPGDPARLGVLHCFTGDLAFARRLLDLGLHISFSGIVTFRKADALRDVAREVPGDRLLVETDAPYLAPVPHRGRTNEPAFVVEVAAALAEIRNDSVERIADITSTNARRLFGLEAQGAT